MSTVLRGRDYGYSLGLMKVMTLLVISDEAIALAGLKYMLASSQDVK